mgnify:CR=1 FL=1
MLSGIAKALLAATALSPVALCYMLIACFEGQFGMAFSVGLVCVILTITCSALLRKSKEYIPTEELKITSATPADGGAVAMLIVYLLPLFTANFTDLNWQVWIPAIFLIGGLVATGHCFSFNPLMRIMGWHYFNVNTPEGIGYMLITKQKIKKSLTVIDGKSVLEKLTIIPLTEYIMVDIKE